MSTRPISSRLRFRQYQENLKQRRADGEFKAGTTRGGSDDSITVRQRSFGQLVVRFAELLRGHRGVIGFALATLSLSTLLKLIPPGVTKITIDYILGDYPWPVAMPTWLHIPDDKRDQLLWLAAGVMVIVLVESVVHLWGRWLATRATKRVQTSVRRRVFEHAVRLPLHRVYQLKSGGISSILREDAGGIADLIFSMIYNPWRALLQLIGSLTILAWVDWRLLLGSLALLPTVFFTHRTWISRIRPLFRDIRRLRQDVDSHATEAFGGMRVVRAFGRQRSEGIRFGQGIHLMARQELMAWWWSRAVELVWEILLPMASVGLLVYGGLQVLSGTLSIGDLMMFMAYTAMLLGPIAILATTATQFQNNLAGLDRVLDLLAEPIEMPTPANAITVRPQDVEGRLTIRDLSFKYPGRDDFVLKDVNLEVKAGQMIALVGHSGAGKTTITNLIARFYDPTEGVVELDGIDLRRIEVESYRRLFGIVDQDIFLFDGTVAENIGYAVRDAARGEIEEAAEVASAHEFISEFPDGYDTLIGERGVRLSGGQRQRIAIARAVLADPRILILDEATSNLDTNSERLIQQSLTKLMKGRTSFVIAHRLSTIFHADRIVVIEDGNIVEVGTQAELMAAGSRYRRMVEIQTGSAIAG